jgi:hypothetical protein
LINCGQFLTITDSQVIATGFLKVKTSDGIRDPSLNVILPLAIANKHLFHVLVANARAMQLMDRGESLDTDTTIAWHRGKALQSLQEVVRDLEDAALPLAIMHLILLDWRLQNNAAIQMHTTGLQSILAATRSTNMMALRVTMGLVDSAVKW